MYPRSKKRLIIDSRSGQIVYTNMNISMGRNLRVSVTNSFFFLLKSSILFLFATFFRYYRLINRLWVYSAYEENIIIIISTHFKLLVRKVDLIFSRIASSFLVKSVKLTLWGVPIVFIKYFFLVFNWNLKYVNFFSVQNRLYIYYTLFSERTSRICVCRMVIK